MQHETFATQKSLPDNIVHWTKLNYYNYYKVYLLSLVQNLKQSWIILFFFICITQKATASFSKNNWTNHSQSRSHLNSVLLTLLLRLTTTPPGAYSTWELERWHEGRSLILELGLCRGLEWDRGLEEALDLDHDPEPELESGSEVRLPVLLTLVEEAFPQCCVFWFCWTV